MRFIILFVVILAFMVYGTAAGLWPLRYEYHWTFDGQPHVLVLDGRLR